ncbi:MAG TPA: hypothetical protein VLG37_02315 [Candidatus Saccharimonadales bacterium]|nr:hypothetical protein [Candidatus Saccharimonadales bacterium]
MKIVSPTPEIVGKLDQLWAEDIRPNTYLTVYAEFSETGAEPKIISVTDELCRTVWESLTTKGLPRAQLEVPHFEFDLLRFVDANYRCLRGLESSQTTQHSLEVRSGNGNITNGRQFWGLHWTDFFRRTLSPGLVHFDGINRTDYQSHDPVTYTATRGGATVWWEGEFDLPGQAKGLSSNQHPRYLAWRLSRQARKRPPLVFEDDVIVRSIRPAVHQAPEISQTPENPRLFVRDIVRTT